MWHVSLRVDRSDGPSVALCRGGVVTDRNTMSLRIIGGVWRSRRLARPDNESTRPMPDRVKQSVFNILGSRYGTPGLLPPICVADLFAGSGSMGLEALSRGAERCCFYERDRCALESLRQNIETLRAGPVATVIARDAWRAAARNPAGRPFDLIFLDPPYSDSEDTSPGGSVLQFLQRLVIAEDHQLLVVLHHPARVRYSSAGQGWTIADARPIGSNGITLFVPGNSETESAADALPIHRGADPRES